MLTLELLERVPFAFVRYGDGYLQAIRGDRGMTCDRERYTPNLGAAVTRAWDTFMSCGPRVYAGDWLASSFTGPTDPSIHEAEFRALLGAYTPRFLHPECLLLMRESPELLDFYRTVREDPRRKLYVGPAENYPAFKMLKADSHVVTPMSADLLAQVPLIAEAIASRPFDVLLWGAGMAGTVAVSQVFACFPNRTYINLGSALDPLGRGQTRSAQLSPKVAREFLKELL